MTEIEMITQGESAVNFKTGNIESWFRMVNSYKNSKISAICDYRFSNYSGDCCRMIFHFQHQENAHTISFCV